MPDHVTSLDWVSLFAPTVAALVLAVGLVVGALVTGLLSRLKAWLVAHGQSAAAQAVASAGAVIQPALQTGANTIAGKIASGALDYTNRQQVMAEVSQEVGLVKARVPEMLAIASPSGGALAASMLGKVDALMVAAAPKEPAVGQSITDAVETIVQAKTALAGLEPAAAVPVRVLVNPTAAT
jgi:hypothetical protein